MHPNAQLIEKFYAAFQSHDADAMCACYHPDVTFADPAFGTLRGVQAASMWRMLVERGKDLQVTFSNVQADDVRGSAHWEARYTFSKSRRPVHNIIEAEFVFKDGLIFQHTDRFDFWKWSRMALGVTGTFLGWTPIIQSAVRKNALGGLETYMAKLTTPKG
jgi:ketosteroid isomerase-like protein